MLNSKLKRTSIALVLAVVLMLSLFPVAAFALEDAGAAPEGEGGVILTQDPADSTADTAADTTEPEAETSEAPADDGHDHDDEDNKKGFTLGDIISLAIFGVVIILVLVYCLTHKEKVAKLFRGLKSEFKKIVWTPWNQVRKNTLVVLVVVISAIIAIALFDFLFSQGILALGKLF